MRRSSRLLFVCCLLLMTLLVACSRHGTYTQTFVDDNDSTRSLTLTSEVGMVRPTANFPGNVLFQLFGTDQLQGTYVLKTGERKVNGRFLAGKDGESQWINFTGDDQSEWRVKVLAGVLVGPDEATWSMKRADVKTAATFKIGE